MLERWFNRQINFQIGRWSLERDAHCQQHASLTSVATVMDRGRHSIAESSSVITDLPSIDGENQA